MRLQSRQLWLFLAVFTFGLYARAVDPGAAAKIYGGVGGYAEVVEALMEQAKKQTDPEKKRKLEKEALEKAKQLMELQAAQRGIEKRAGQDTTLPPQAGALDESSIPRSELESMKNGPTTPTTADTSNLPAGSDTAPQPAAVEASPSTIDRTPTPGALGEQGASREHASADTAMQGASRDYVNADTGTSPTTSNPSNGSSDSSGAGSTPPSQESPQAQAPSESKSWFGKLVEKAGDIGEIVTDSANGAVTSLQEATAMSPETMNHIAESVAKDKWNNDSAFRNQINNKAYNEINNEVVSNARRSADQAYPRLLNGIAQGKAAETASRQVTPQVYQVAKQAINDAMNNKAPAPPQGNIVTPGSRRIPSQNISRSQIYNQAYYQTKAEIHAAARNPSASLVSTGSTGSVSNSASRTLSSNQPTTPSAYRSRNSTSSPRIFGRFRRR